MTHAPELEPVPARPAAPTQAGVTQIHPVPAQAEASAEEEVLETPPLAEADASAGAPELSEPVGTDETEPPPETVDQPEEAPPLQAEIAAAAASLRDEQAAPETAELAGLLDRASAALETVEPAARAERGSAEPSPARPADQNLAANMLALNDLELADTYYLARAAYTAEANRTADHRAQYWRDVVRATVTEALERPAIADPSKPFPRAFSPRRRRALRQLRQACVAASGGVRSRPRTAS